MRNFSVIAHALVYFGHWLRVQGQAQKEMETYYTRHMKQHPAILHMVSWFMAASVCIFLGFFIAALAAIQLLRPDTIRGYSLSHGVAIMALGFTLLIFRASITRLFMRYHTRKEVKEKEQSE